MGSKKWFLVLAVLLFIIGGAVLLSLLPQSAKDKPDEPQTTVNSENPEQLDELGAEPEDDINDDMPPEETPPLEDLPKKP